MSECGSLGHAHLVGKVALRQPTERGKHDEQIAAFHPIAGGNRRLRIRGLACVETQVTGHRATVTTAADCNDPERELWGFRDLAGDCL